MYWSQRATSASTASTQESLYLDTNLSSLLLNLEANKSKSSTPHLWHRYWNIFRCRDHYPWARHCQLGKFASQLSARFLVPCWCMQTAWHCPAEFGLDDPPIGWSNTEGTANLPKALRCLLGDGIPLTTKSPVQTRSQAIPPSPRG